MAAFCCSIDFDFEFHTKQRKTAILGISTHSILGIYMHERNMLHFFFLSLRPLLNEATRLMLPVAGASSASIFSLELLTVSF